MHRPLCTALALTLASSIAGAAPPAQAPAGAAPGNLSCTARNDAHRFLRGSADFDTAMDFLVAQSRFPSGAAKIVPPRTATSIDVKVEAPMLCGDQAGSSTAGHCTGTDCGDVPFAPAAFAPGTRLAMQTCTNGMHTALDWVAGSDGWTLLRAAQELTSQCEPTG